MRSILSFNDLEICIHAFVSSQFEYGYSLYKELSRLTFVLSCPDPKCNSSAPDQHQKEGTCTVFRQLASLLWLPEYKTAFVICYLFLNLCMTWHRITVFSKSIGTAGAILLFFCYTMKTFGFEIKT